MQFDSKQAFKVLAQAMRPNLPESFLDLVKCPEINIAALVEMVSFHPKTARAEDHSNLALFAAVVGSYARWGHGDEDPFVEILQGRREIGKHTPAVYSQDGKTEVSPCIASTEEVLFGAELVKMLDARIEENLKIGPLSASVSKWYFTSVSGVLHVNFPKPMTIGQAESFPVASATPGDLDKARKVIGEFVVSRGVPSDDAAYETICKLVASACSPTIVGGWLNLGLYMVSSWEYARRELVREGDDPGAIPNIRPIDDDSIIDCYASIFDLGPFRLVRVFSINHLCRTMPDAGAHKFEVTVKHAAEARRMDTKLDPSFAPCGICGGEYKDHSYERALGVSLTRDVTQDECKKYLDPMALAFKADGIDGFAFVETPEKFRVEGEGAEAAKNET